MIYEIYYRNIIDFCLMKYYHYKMDFAIKYLYQINSGLSYYTRRFVNIFFNSRVPSERLPKVFAWNSLSIYATALYGPSVDRIKSQLHATAIKAGSFQHMTLLVIVIFLFYSKIPLEFWSCSC